MENKDAKIITVSNLKGGVGKSFITSTFALKLKKLKMKVLVIDSDNKQRTIQMVQERDKNRGILLDDCYDVLPANSLDAVEYVPQLIKDYDYIFIDLPGNFEQPGVLSAILLSDHIFVSTSLSDDDLDSTTKYLELLYSDIIPARKKIGLETKITGVLFRVNIKTIEYKQFMKNKEDLPISFMKNVIPDSPVLSRENSTSILSAYESKNFIMADFLNEFYKVVKTKN